jgi:PleD family two-component response regulator
MPSTLPNCATTFPPVNQIIGYSERLQGDAEAGGHKAYVSDLQKIQLAARQLLELVNSKLNVETLSGVVSRSPSSHTSAHRRANQPLGDGHGETGFFARYNGQILVADDNAENRDMLSRRVKRQGMKVETATDGRQALEFVRSRPFDVVLLDVTF